MKTVTLTPSSRTPARDRPDVGSRSDACYFPECRKDANCNCKMCLASIHATLDLVPSGSAITTLSTARRSRRRALELPVETPPATPKTPGSASVASWTPLTKSTAKSKPPEKPVRKVRSWALGYRVFGFVLGGLFLFLAMDSAFTGAIWRGFGPRLDTEMVKRFLDESRAISGDLGGKLRFLQQKVGGFGGLVSDCSSMDSNWEFVQDGRTFFHWRCVVYQSAAEELRIWGSPIASSGLMPYRFSDRSMMVISGRITEWSRGRMTSISRTSNSSYWISRPSSSVAVQLEAGTWIVEYQRSILFQGQGLILTALDAMRERVVMATKELKHDPWRLLMLPKFTDLYYFGAEENHSVNPT